MTKKEAIERKANWAKALAEGRVVRYNSGMSLKSWPTVQQARDDVRAINTFGAGDASIVVIPSVAT